MQYLLYFLSIPFLYLNYKIVVSDFKYKTIPNKYLAYLLGIIPFYYIYIFFSFPNISYLLFLLQIFLTFFISFILYYFNIWAAWDAKYLLVLSLFIPYIWIIPFIWNIGLITIIYLLLYFLWFYFWKCVFYKWYFKNLFVQIKTDLNERWEVHKSNKLWSTYKIIIKFILIFFIIFVSIRLSRIYLFKSFFENWNNFSLIQDFIEKYNIYLIFWLIIVFVWWLYLFILLMNKLKAYIVKKLKLNMESVSNMFILFLFLLLFIFIVYELVNNYTEISILLFRIFTIYLGLYIIIKILFYSYKVTFWIAEYNLIDVKNLKKGDIVDKEYLIKLFWYDFKKENTSSYVEVSKKEKIIHKITWENINLYFKKIDNSISNIKIKELQNIFKIQKQYEKNSTNIIKILNTFSFWPYIFLWFMLTFLLEDKIFKYISSLAINLIKYFY